MSKYAPELINFHAWNDNSSLFVSNIVLEWIVRVWSSFWTREFSWRIFIPSVVSTWSPYSRTMISVAKTVIRAWMKTQQGSGLIVQHSKPFTMARSPINVKVRVNISDAREFRTVFFRVEVLFFVWCMFRAIAEKISISSTEIFCTRNFTLHPNPNRKSPCWKFLNLSPDCFQSHSILECETLPVFLETHHRRNRSNNWKVLSRISTNTKGNYWEIPTRQGSECVPNTPQARARNA